MIRRSVSAAYLLRDGFTGRPMSSASVQCELDGCPCAPLWKPGGYLVLTDLEPGDHRLLLRGRGYRAETVDFTTVPGKAVEEALNLKPDKDYPFRGEEARLSLTLTAGGRPLADSEVWLAGPARTELKLVQGRAEAGDCVLRLFFRGVADRLPVPGPFLLSDGADSEVVRLRTLAGERGILAAPLERAHGRGSLLLPVQHFHTNRSGQLDAVFHTPGAVEVLVAGGHGAFTLSGRDNILSLDL